MITTINSSDVKSDMLKPESNVQEILRALYFYGTDYIMIIMGRRERLVHKEQLVALLEQGRERATIADIMSVILNEPLSARMQIEDIPSAAALLVFVQRGSNQSGELSRTTFEAYRDRKIREDEVVMEEWWGVPLPLIHIENEKIFMNDRALEVVPCDAQTMARQIDRMRLDRIVTVRDKKREKTYSLQPLSEGTFLLEDISGDFEMAEELVWWAAVGRAFFHRLEENGAVIRRVSPYEDPPATAAEIIPCSWEGEHLGSLAIELPGEMMAEAPPDDDAAPKSAGPGDRHVKEITPPREARHDMESEEAPMNPELDESKGNSGNIAKLNKNAARKAYGGGASRRPASSDEQKS